MISSGKLKIKSLNDLCKILKHFYFQIIYKIWWGF
jgi:hypothetical protein